MMLAREFVMLHAHDTVCVRRQHPMKAGEMQARARYQSGQPLHEFERRHDKVAHAIAMRIFSSTTTCPARFTLTCARYCVFCVRER
jgi:hypothetical protein